jgi:predicted acyl esterase
VVWLHFRGSLVARCRRFSRSRSTSFCGQRDGVKLHTMVDMPIFENAPSTNLTAVMDRSPYGQDATEMFAFASSFFGHVGIRQDMRGTKKSEGNFT